MSRPQRSRLDEPLVKAIGPSAKLLHANLAVETVGDLVRHYPRRYAERGQLTDFGKLKIGDHVTVLARVTSVTTRRMRQRSGYITTAIVTDGNASLTLVFFSKSQHRVRKPTEGRTGLFAGQVTVYEGRVRQLVHPDFEMLEGDGSLDAVEAFAGKLIPVYPATIKVSSWQIAKAMRTVVDTLADVPDPVPAAVRLRRGMLGLSEAYRCIHKPETRDEARRARDRLKYDEAFVLQVVLAQRRTAARALSAVPRAAVDGGLVDALDARLPFTLTKGQHEVAHQLTEDLAADHPMNRLLQGEVGSGKTIVALRAMLAVVDAGGQAALLAPTEVLAQQHHRSISAMLGPLAERGLLGGSDVGTRVALLTGSQSAAQRRQNMLDVTTGEAGIVVGTHALLEENVQFFDLGLVVVDEQHRFGVEQRDALRAKGRVPPHVLVMTATPIPRTVAMTVFGDLDVSTLTELPIGRAPITTHVVPATDKPTFLDRAWLRVREEVAAGHQAYVVCPRIGDAEGSDDLEPVRDDDEDSAQRRPPLAVLDIAPMLAEGPLAGLRLEVLHGRMAPDDKDDVMTRFARGDVDVLVATTVIEVGVDVPNATVMAVMDADRFGVSQLHQLRGRVGRGTAAALCLLVTDLPEGSPSRERLDAVAATTDGFALSQVDLENRREGDVLGSSQSGRRSSLRLLSVLRDEDLIIEARADAVELVEADPTLARHPELRDAIEDSLGEWKADYLEKG